MIYFEKFITAVIILSLLSAFFLGPYALEGLGIQYVSEGGSVFLKLHLYSYLIIMLFICFIARYGFNKIIQILGCLFSAWLLLMAAIFWVIAYGLYTSGFAGLAFFIDTLLIPMLIFPLVLSLSNEKKILISLLILALIVFNSFSSLFEYVQSTHILPLMHESFFYFRSQAWLAHPLNNSLIIASVVPVLISYRFINPLLLFGVILVSLLTFGARSATTIYFFLSGFSVVYFLFCEYRDKSGIDFVSLIIYAALVFLMPLTLYFLIANYNIGARIFENFVIDSSGQTRFDLFYAFDFLTLHEILFGVSFDFLDNIDHFIGNQIIENYLVAWMLGYGLIGAGPLILFFLNFLVKLFFVSGVFARMSVASFFLISITNNALSIKTSAFLFFLVCIASVKELIDQNGEKSYV